MIITPIAAKMKSLVTTGAQKAHAGDFDGATYDVNYPQRIKDTIY